ncbi:MAG: FeoB-associated Cys-rich membrane protein [Bacteroidetes bacterium]|nr:FeoB-associated Cys-rich membrane protein [Bacteroidota bacterium]
MQQILVYLMLASAVFYLGYRAYLTFRKKSAKGCASCPANEKA